MGTICSSCTETKPEQTTATKRLIDTERSQQSESEGVFDGVENSQSAQSSSINSTTTTNTFDLSKEMSLFEDLSKFMRELPARSKGHIWKHSVKVKQEDGSKAVCDKADDEQLILKLLIDTVIVYVKYLDRNRAPLTTKQVKPHVEGAAKWIFQKYHAIDRNQFENDKNYFASMLEAYQQRDSSI